MTTNLVLPRFCSRLDQNAFQKILSKWRQNLSTILFSWKKCHQNQIKKKLEKKVQFFLGCYVSPARSPPDSCGTSPHTGRSPRPQMLLDWIPLANWLSNQVRKNLWTPNFLRILNTRSTISQNLEIAKLSKIILKSVSEHCTSCGTNCFWQWFILF